MQNAYEFQLVIEIVTNFNDNNDYYLQKPILLEYDIILIIAIQNSTSLYSAEYYDGYFYHRQVYHVDVPDDGVLDDDVPEDDVLDDDVLDDDVLDDDVLDDDVLDDDVLDDDVLDDDVLDDDVLDDDVLDDDVLDDDVLDDDVLDDDVLDDDVLDDDVLDDDVLDDDVLDDDVLDDDVLDDDVLDDDVLDDDVLDDDVLDDDVLDDDVLDDDVLDYDVLDDDVLDDDVLDDDVLDDDVLDDDVLDDDVLDDDVLDDDVLDDDVLDDDVLDDDVLDDDVLDDDVLDDDVLDDDVLDDDVLDDDVLDDDVLDDDVLDYDVLDDDVLDDDVLDDDVLDDDVLDDDVLDDDVLDYDVLDYDVLDYDVLDYDVSEDDLHDDDVLDDDVLDNGLTDFDVPDDVVPNNDVLDDDVSGDDVPDDDVLDDDVLDDDVLDDDVLDDDVLDDDVLDDDVLDDDVLDDDVLDDDVLDDDVLDDDVPDDDVPDDVPEDDGSTRRNVVTISYTNWKLGDYCCAQSTVDSVWFRGLIISEPFDEICNVLLLDNGRTEKLTFNRLRKLKPEFFDIPRLAILCSLQSIRPADIQGTNTWSYKSIAACRDILAPIYPLQCTFTAILQSDKKIYDFNLIHYEVVLVDIERLINPSIHLVQNGFAWLNLHPNIEGPRCFNDMLSSAYPVQNLSNTTWDISVSTFRKLDDFYVQLCVRNDELQMLKSQIELDVSKTMIMTSPSNEIGAPCLAPYTDGKYYRSIFLECNLETCHVFYVDYGNSSSIVRTSCLPVLNHLKVINMFAHKCSLRGIQMVESKDPTESGMICERIKAEIYKLNSSKASCTFYEQSQGVYDVTIHFGSQNFAEHLQSLGLVRYFDSSQSPTTTAGRAIIRSEKMYSSKSANSTTVNNRPIVINYNKFISPTLTVQPGMYEAVSVVTIQSPQEFYIWLTKLNTDNQILCTNLNTFYNQRRQTNLNINELTLSCAIVVKFKDVYYRASVREISESHIFARLVDFGNVVKVFPDDIYECAPEFLLPLSRGIACTLHGFDEIAFSDSVTKQMEELCLKKDHFAKIVGINSRQFVQIVLFILDQANNYISVNDILLQALQPETCKRPNSVPSGNVLSTQLKLGEYTQIPSHTESKLGRQRIPSLPRQSEKNQSREHDRYRSKPTLSCDANSTVNNREYLQRYHIESNLDDLCDDDADPRKTQESSKVSGYTRRGGFGITHDRGSSSAHQSSLSTDLSSSQDSASNLTLRKADVFEGDIETKSYRGRGGRGGRQPTDSVNNSYRRSEGSWGRFASGRSEFDSKVTDVAQSKYNYEQHTTSSKHSERHDVVHDSSHRFDQSGRNFPLEDDCLSDVHKDDEFKYNILLGGSERGSDSGERFYRGRGDYHRFTNDGERANRYTRTRHDFDRFSGDSERGNRYTRGRGDFGRSSGDGERGVRYSRVRGDFDRTHRDGERESRYTRGRGDSERTFGDVERGGRFSRGRGDYSRLNDDSERGSRFSRGRGDYDRSSGDVERGVSRFTQNRNDYEVSFKDGDGGERYSRGRGTYDRFSGGSERGGQYLRGRRSYDRSSGERGTRFSRGRGNSDRNYCDNNRFSREDPENVKDSGEIASESLPVRVSDEFKSRDYSDGRSKFYSRESYTESNVNSRDGTSNARRNQRGNRRGMPSRGSGSGSYSNEISGFSEYKLSKMAECWDSDENTSIDDSVARDVDNKIKLDSSNNRSSSPPAIVSSSDHINCSIPPMNSTKQSIDLHSKADQINIYFKIVNPHTAVKYTIRLTAVDCHCSEQVASSLLSCSSSQLQKNNEFWYYNSDENGNAFEDCSKSDIDVLLTGIADHGVLDCYIDFNERSFFGYLNSDKSHLQSNELVDYLVNTGGYTRYEICAVPMVDIPREPVIVRTLQLTSFPHASLHSMDELRAKLDVELKKLKETNTRCPIKVRPGIYAIADVNQSLQRSIIISVDDTVKEASIFQFDIGSYEFDVSYENLSALTKPLWDIPVLALRCANILDEDDECKEIEVTFLNNYSPFVIAECDDGIDNADANDTITTALIWPGDIVYAMKHKDTDKIVIRLAKAKYPTYMPLELNEDHDVAEKQFVLLQHNSIWYRGERVDHDTYNLIDQGIYFVSQNMFTDIRPLPMQYMKFSKLSLSVQKPDNFDESFYYQEHKVEIIDFVTFLVKLHPTTSSQSKEITEIQKSGHYILNSSFFEQYSNLIEMLPVDIYPLLSDVECTRCCELFSNVEFKQPLMSDVVNYVRHFMAVGDSNITKSLVFKNLNFTLTSYHSKLIDEIESIVKKYRVPVNDPQTVDSVIFAVDDRRCRYVAVEDDYQKLICIDTCELIDDIGDHDVFELPPIIQRLPALTVSSNRSSVIVSDGEKLLQIPNESQIKSYLRSASIDEIESSRAFIADQESSELDSNCKASSLCVEQNGEVLGIKYKESSSFNVSEPGEKDECPKNDDEYEDVVLENSLIKAFSSTCILDVVASDIDQGAENVLDINYRNQSLNELSHLTDDTNLGDICRDRQNEFTECISQKVEAFATDEKCATETGNDEHHEKSKLNDYEISDTEWAFVMESLLSRLKTN
ncbi:hypothetical protein GJ496_008837 [Pomphorhynchus laevis]|nr:hypothetical protein GJ496_008837 [Pomphorhynchus laevis]